MSGVSTQYGITPQGFVPKQQSEITLELQTALQGAFGANVDFDPTGPLGQLLNICAERLAEVWSLAEAVYASRYPAGAEGQDVDNILALNNLKRLPASPTTTAPTSTSVVPGLVLFGTPGTVISSGLIGTAGGLQFSLSSPVTINAAVNAVQLISFYGGAPTSGYFTLSIVDSHNNALTTPQITYNTLANQTTVSFATLPTSGSWYLQVGALVTGALPYNATAAQVQAAIQVLTGYSMVTVTGSMSAFTISWGSLSQPIVQSNASLISFSASATSGSWSLGLGGLTTTGLSYNATAAQVQAAINALSGYSLVTVTGSTTNGFVINWGWVAPPALSIPANTTGVSITTGAYNTVNEAPTVVNSVQCALNTLYDAGAAVYPYTDVSVTGTLSVGLTVSFGSLSPLSGQPSSGGAAQNLLTSNSQLFSSSTLLNVGIVAQQIGAPAQGIGAAVCTVDGPNFVAAGSLTEIITPVSGWTGVNNPLDCITGSYVETDTAAIARRTSLLAAQANGPLAAIQEKVAQLPGVVSVSAFANTGLAAQQILTFVGTPTSGSFTLTFQGPGGVAETTAPIAYNALANGVQLFFSGQPTGGSFTLTLGNETTAPIPYSSTSLTVQQAITALSGFSGVTVTGSFVNGFVLYFNNMAVPAVSLTNNLTPTTTASVVNSLQGAINALANYNDVTITGSFALGFTISFNGSAGGTPQTLAVLNAASLVGTVASISFGRPGKSFELVINDNNGAASNSLIADTILAAKGASNMAYGNTIVPAQDGFGNYFQIGFSRPTQVNFYVTLSLVTDISQPNPTFSLSSLTTIQQDLVQIVNGVPPGGSVRGLGTNGLLGAFNNVPGILDYTLNFGTSPNPVGNAAINLSVEQVPLLETYNVLISYS